MSNPTPILNNINAFDATKGTTISFNIIGGTDIVRSNIVYIYDLSTNDLICTHLYISTESIHELPPNTDPSIVYASGKSSADFVNNKNYYLQIQTFTNTAGTAGGSGMSVAKTFWCLFNPALSVNTIPAAISTTSYNFGATYTTNITDVTIPVTNIIQQYKFDLYTATGTLVQTSGNIIGSGEQEGTSTTYNITYNFSGLVVNNSYYVVVTTTSTEGMTVSAQSNTFAVSIDTPTVGGAIVNNNACDGYISVVSNLSDEYGGSASGEMASFETDSVNNVSSLKVNMEPIQDLHGYDHPWVGGAGKNTMPPLTAGTYTLNGITAVVDDNGLITVTGTKNVSTGMVITIPLAQPFDLKTGKYVHYRNSVLRSDITFRVGSFERALSPQNRITEITSDIEGISNCTIYITSSVADSLNFTIQPSVEGGNTATAWTPYSNICPISGHDDVDVVHTGVNVWDEEWEVGSIGTSDGQNTNSSTLIRSKNYVPVIPNMTYFVKAPASSGGNLFYYDADKNYLSYVGLAVNINYTIPSNARYVRFRMGSAYGATYNHDISINYPSTDHEYHAYVGNDYTQDIEVTYTPTVQENEPYQFKRTGDVGGDRETIELVGGTVAWNQKLPTIESAGWEAENQSSVSISDGVIEATFSSGNPSVYLPAARPKVEAQYIAGHKYLCSLEFKSTKDGYPYFRNEAFGTSFPFNSNIKAANTWWKYEGIAAATNSVSWRGYFGQGNATSAGLTFEDVVSFRNVMLFDLTAMFGTTIADYIYSLEQSQAGAGVAWFRQYFPKDYYPYDKGTLRSVEGVSAHETVGFNQWDGTSNIGYYWSDSGVLTPFVNNSCTGKIPVIPSRDYYFINKVTNATVKFYDNSMTLLTKRDISSSTIIKPPSGCAYLCVNYSSATGVPPSTCINLSDPTRNGEYEPYVKHSYPLDNSLTLRGVPKLVDGKLAFDGDVYPPSGEVQRRYGIVDLGTLAWRIGSTSGGGAPRMVGTLADAKGATAGSEIPNMLCLKYQTVSANQTYNRVTGVSDNIGGGVVVVFDPNYTDPATFKAAMSGVYLVYELATPTTETAEPFTNPQVVDNRGTEAYITTGIVPVGHDTTYLTRDIFGGTLDLVTGVLTVDRAMVDMTAFADRWQVDLAYERIYVIVDEIEVPQVQPANILCNRFEAITFNALYVQKQQGVAVSGGKALQFHINGLTDDASVSRYKVVQWFADNPTQVVYKLATPQTYQLTPHQIQTLVGQNNVWSDAGDVDITFNLPITNLLVKRQDTSDTSGDWLTLYSQPITQASDMDFTFIDFLNQHGKTYKYALVPLLTQQQGDIDVEIEGGYTVSDDVLSVFDGVFVANSNGSQKLKATTEYGDLETNQDVGVLTTIGNKYPFVVSNSNLNYHSGSISALIVPSDFYTNGDLDRLDIVERREAIEKFLTDKTAKILKDWNGNIWLITFVENVEVSFVDDYGMGLGTLSAKWVEIGDVNDQTDLKQTGLI